MSVGDILRGMRARPDVGWGPACAALACAGWLLAACADSPDPDYPPPAMSAGTGAAGLGGAAGAAVGADGGMG
ncbi:MAG TPA: hypothetical protein VK509_22090, partial [Polyangiales bacterium]|nr:hypothetical protein [Polyangiales bacterium]